MDFRDSQGILKLGTFLGLLVATLVLIVGIQQPLLDLFAFRQTQTALSSYWMLHGGPWFAYETPVLGYPWAAPMEFPVYQFFTVALASVGIPLDIAGRLISYFFFVIVLFPLKLCFEGAKLPTGSFWVAAILYLFSPLYLYWQRTFMIESTALFFCVLWLALLIRYVNNRNNLIAVLAILAGSIGVLAKATTYPAFGALGAIVVASTLFEGFRDKVSFSKLLKLAILGLLIGATPIIIGSIWVYESDVIKSGGELANKLSSAQLQVWNFGTIEQRFGEKLWLNVLLGRILPDVLGYFFGFFVILAFFLVKKSKSGTFEYNYEIIALIVSFFVPIMLFTNLHEVHSYYQYSNGIFIICAAGIFLYSLEKINKNIFYTSILIVISGQILTFEKRYMNWVAGDISQNGRYMIAKFASENTPKNTALIIFGDDWSSMIPYYAERKSLAVPNWVNSELLEKILSDMPKYLGGLPLAGVVVCEAQLYQYGNNEAAINRFLSHHPVIKQIEGCSLRTP